MLCLSEFLLFLQSKNLSSVTPEMLKRSHVPDSSMRSSGDSSGEVATKGSAGLIATSVSNDDRDGHKFASCFEIHRLMRRLPNAGIIRLLVFPESNSRLNRPRKLSLHCSPNDPARLRGLMYLDQLFCN
jgi:hypothetical protein